MLLQLHVLAHTGVGYVSLRDGIMLGRCIHFFSVAVSEYSSMILGTFFHGINYFFTFMSEIHAIQFCV